MPIYTTDHLYPWNIFPVDYDPSDMEWVKSVPPNIPSKDESTLEKYRRLQEMVDATKRIGEVVKTKTPVAVTRWTLRDLEADPKQVFILSNADDMDNIGILYFEKEKGVMVGTIFAEIENDAQKNLLTEYLHHDNLMNDHLKSVVSEYLYVEKYVEMNRVDARKNWYKMVREGYSHDKEWERKIRRLIKIALQ